MSDYYLPSQKWLVYNDCAIEVLPSGRFKAIVYGVPRYHMMSWAGENIHKLTIDKQPLRGFESARDALSFLFDRFKTEKEAEEWCNSRKQFGTWHNGNGWYFVDFKKQSAKLYGTPPGVNLEVTEVCLK